MVKRRLQVRAGGKKNEPSFFISIPTDLAGVSVLKEFSNFRKKAKMRTDNVFHRPAVHSNFYFF